MATLGQYSLFLALSLALYAVGGSIVGARGRDLRLLRSARYATYLTALVSAVAVVALIAAFMTRDFRVQYVYEHSNRALGPLYTFMAFYAGNAGSLLYITLNLAVMAAVAVAWPTRAARGSLPYTTAVLMVVVAFFVGVVLFLSNPFKTFPFTPPDGNGLNPLLVHYGMLFHPPTMMTGLAAVAVPFSFALGALLSGRSTDEWIDAGRVWGLVAWLLLAAGNLFGMWWAYTILGWGGYWAWDPIENAGLMPWLAMTALIHSLVIQRRWHMFRLWNYGLIIFAFGLAQFGMFLNRGGPVVSVHSFAQSPLGWSFLVFMAGSTLVAFLVVLWQYPRIKSERTVESSVSREAAFLVNNLILLAIALATLWGVIFPLVSNLFVGETITIGAPFYNQVNGPLMMALLALLAVGPFIPWRRASVGALKRALLVPALLGLATMVLLGVLGVRLPWALLGLGLCVLVTAGIGQELVRGVAARHRHGEAYPVALGRLVRANPPRYGGHIVHLAVVMVAAGIIGSHFYTTQREVVLSPGQSVTVGDYTVQFQGARVIPKIDHLRQQADLLAYKGDRLLGTLSPWQAEYPNLGFKPTRVAIRSTPVEDLYVILGELLDDGRASLQVKVMPVVAWMWWGGVILLVGILVCLWPAPSRRVGMLASRPAVAPAPALPRPVGMDQGTE
ncbi:MAG: heme lyase CcmF/NrfE family subunit [Chloroflexi bacterium]|nr:heme lyase CcmF/NrfE family subunit [Chloroflexota bacterium]